jgi:hypothetical protein
MVTNVIEFGTASSRSKHRVAIRSGPAAWRFYQNQVDAATRKIRSGEATLLHIWESGIAYRVPDLDDTEFTIQIRQEEE